MWQPIETAPKDGREILAWGTLHDDGLGETPHCLIVEWCEPYGFFQQGVGGHQWEGLTHWMPLPALPAA